MIKQPWHQTTARKSGVVSRRRYVFLIVQCGASLAEATTGDPSAPCSCKIERVVVENPLSRVGHTQVAAFGAFFENRWQA